LVWLDDAYRRVIHRALEHRPTVLATGALLFVIALVLLPTIPFELMPQTDEGEVNIDVELPVGTRIERTDEVMRRLEGMTRDAVPEAETIIASAGGGGFRRAGGYHRGRLEVRLVPLAERTRSSDEIAQDLRRRLSGLPGAIIRARASGSHNIMTRIFSGGMEQSRLALEIRGHELEDARRLSLRAKAVLDTTPGIADARIGREEGRPELAINVDRPKAAVLGLRQSEVAETIRTNVAGTQAAYYRERGNEYPIIVRLREEDRERVRDVDDIRISTPTGQLQQAKNLMSVRMQTGPVQIERKNQERITYINAELETTLSEAMDSVTARFPEMNIPRDFSVGFGAEAEEQAKAFGELRLMLILAIILVYAVMASQYESLRDPFIIMFSIPLAAIGVVASLMLTGTAFSLQAYIGVIMLAGIVVSNAILLVDYTNTLRRRDGLPLRQAVEEAGRTRLRPILMTTLTTVLGLLPLSLGIGEGAELQAPMGRVVIGGLLASTVITLVFVPTMYTLFEEGLVRLRGGLKHEAGERAAAVGAESTALEP
jgi:HAE1 family hydrophobic/amphiphilic exporter-1